MMPTERFERQLPELLTELAAPRTPDYLDDLLWQTANTSQRPAWSFLERWLPMLDVARQPIAAPPMPWRTIGVGIVLLALLLALVAALTIGSPKPLPAPFGPAQNGLVAYAADGDVFVADPVTGVSATVVGGPETDRDPRWSLDGTKLAFERKADGGKSLIYVVNADGSDLTLVTPDQLSPIDYRFSPDGREVLISARRLGGAPDLVIAKTDGSEIRAIDVGMPVSDPSWRPPDGAGILYTSEERSIHVVDPDNGLARAVVPQLPGQYSGLARWSPDGSQIAYTAWVDSGELTARIHIVNADGSSDRMLSLPPGALWQGDAYWSNDGTRLIAWRGYTGTFEESVGVVLPADGSGFGTEIDLSGVIGLDCCALWEWAPDDSSILGTSITDTDERIEQFVVDPVKGTAKIAPWTSTSRPSWQRLAP